MGKQQQVSRKLRILFGTITAIVMIAVFIWGVLTFPKIFLDWYKIKHRRLKMMYRRKMWSMSHDSDS